MLLPALQTFTQWSDYYSYIKLCNRIAIPSTQYPVAFPPNSITFGKTFLRCPILFVAFPYIDSFPEFFDSFNKFLLTLWLDNTTNVLFKFMPKIFDWIHIWGFGWSFPPVDLLLDLILGHILKCVLGHYLA